jgi:hypothetical protein
MQQKKLKLWGTAMRTFASVALLCFIAMWQPDGIAATRCEDAAGKVNYVEGACPSGTRSVREVGKPVTPPVADQTSAVNRATQEYKDAERMRIAREKQEKLDAKALKARASAQKKADDRKRSCTKLQNRIKEVTDDISYMGPGKKRDRLGARLKEMKADYEAKCK